MAVSDEYVFKVKCSVDDEIDGIKSLFANAQATADKNAIVVRVTGDEKELAKELKKLTELNPSVLAKVVLDVDSGNLKETSDFLSKVIGKQLKQSNDISKAFKDQITSGIDERQIRDLLSSTLKSAFGDSTKITAGNISDLYKKLKEEANELKAATLQGMDTDKAFSRITELAKKLEILQAAFKNQDAAGLTKTLKPGNLDFNVKELKATIGDFYKEIGDYIGSDTQKLNDDITAAYTKVKDNLLQNLIQIFSNGGKVMLETLSIGGAEEQIRRNNAEIEKVKNGIADEVQKAQNEINQILKKGYVVSDKTPGRLAQAYANYKVYTGKEYTGLTAEQEENSNAILQGAGNREKYIKIAEQWYEAQNNQLKAIATNNRYWENYIATQRGEIGTEVASQMNAINSGKISGNSVNVEIEPVISDPAAFVAKIEKQLANQIVKVVIEPTIKSAAEFEQLLQQQLPNQFIDIKPIIDDITAFQEQIRSQIGTIPITVDPTVTPTAKENLKEIATLDFSEALADLDKLKAMVSEFKGEIDKFQTSAGAVLSTISSLLGQASGTSPNSNNLTGFIDSLTKLSRAANRGINDEKVESFIQALERIGKLKINPNVDFANFNLRKLNSYLKRSNELKELGTAFSDLAAGLEPLKKVLTDANFESLKTLNISSKTVENLPKFADGILKLGEKLEKFSSSATNVLSSISQLASQTQSLEYLYKLATASGSNTQSNIIGNGLMSAFDKSAINSTQHPAGSTDEVAALAKEYQWLTSQAKIYFDLSSKFAKGTISSNDAAKLMQLQRAMEGAIQRMSQFQETDQSLITAQNDLNTALAQNGSAIENALVNNLNKAIGKIDETQAETLGFKDALDAVKNKATDIQNAFSSNGLISSKEIENAEVALKKALEDVKQLKADISAAQKKQDTEVKNSYKNILGDYSKTALGSTGNDTAASGVEVKKLANEYDYLNQMVAKYIQLLKEDASSKSINADRLSKIQALTKAYEDFVARQKAGVDTDTQLQSSVDALNTSLSGMAQKLSGELTGSLESYISRITEVKDGATKYAASIEKMKQAQAAIGSQLSNGTTEFATLKNALDAYSSGLTAYRSVLSEVTAAERDATEAEKAALALDMQKWANKNTKAAEKYKNELKALQDQLSKVTDRGGLESVRTGYLKLQNQAETLKETGISFADVMKAKFKELGTYLMSFASFYQVINILKTGISIVHEYDDAFTEMRKVTDASTSSLKEFQKESFELANHVGTTAEQLQQSTADWLRLGESFEEAKKSAQDANILLNVSEFDDISSATDSLVAMSQAYQDLDKMDIIDKLNNVG